MGCIFFGYAFIAWFSSFRASNPKSQPTSLTKSAASPHLKMMNQQFLPGWTEITPHFAPPRLDMKDEG